MPQDDATRLSKSPALREKQVAVGLIEPETIPEKQARRLPKTPCQAV
jgi:hypothetical protein